MCRTLIFLLTICAGISSANASGLHQGTFTNGNNAIFEILDGKYLIYCHDGAPNDLNWQCRRREYEAAGTGFVVQYNRNVPREDSVVLELNKSASGYQLIHKRPRTSENQWQVAEMKPAGLAMPAGKCIGSFGPRKNSEVTYKPKAIRNCFNGECSDFKFKSFGSTVRIKYRNGDNLYLTPISATAVVGTYIQTDGQYTAQYKCDG